MFTVAAAPFKMPKALTIGGGMRSWGWLMRKLDKDRSVWAPQYLSAGTWISPKASLSVLVLLLLLLLLLLAAILELDAWNRLLGWMARADDVGGTKGEEWEEEWEEWEKAGEGHDLEEGPDESRVSGEERDELEKHVLRGLELALGANRQPTAGAQGRGRARTDRSIELVVIEAKKQNKRNDRWRKTRCERGKRGSQEREVEGELEGKRKKKKKTGKKEAAGNRTALTNRQSPFKLRNDPNR